MVPPHTLSSSPPPSLSLPPPLPPPSSQTANELGLELHKTIKLESTAQLGYFMRVTKKVGVANGKGRDVASVCSVGVTE